MVRGSSPETDCHVVALCTRPVSLRITHPLLFLERKAFTSAFRVPYLLVVFLQFFRTAPTLAVLRRQRGRRQRVSEDSTRERRRRGRARHRRHRRTRTAGACGGDHAVRVWKNLHTHTKIYSNFRTSILSFPIISHLDFGSVLRCFPPLHFIPIHSV